MKTYPVKRAMQLPIILFVLLMFSVPLTAMEVNEQGEILERSGNGSINWSTGKLEATGMADPDQPVYGQVKAAQIAARAELLAIFKGIRIRGEYGVIQGILRKDISETKIQGFLSNSYVTKPRTNELGLIEAKAFIYLDENGNTILMPEKVVFKDNRKTWNAPVSSVASSVEYSGLVIDARGLDLKPAMAPRILVEGALTELYPGAFIDQNTALRHGIVGYAGTLDKALKIVERTGKNPMVIKAEGTANGTDVIISSQNAIKLAGVLKFNDFLRECRVVIIVGDT